MTGSSIIAVDVKSPAFQSRRRRVWRISFSLTFFSHGAFFAALLYGVIASLLGLNAKPSLEGIAASETPEKTFAPLELADLPLPPPPANPASAISSAPPGLDPTLYKRLLALGVRDFSKSPAELARLTKRAENISDSSLVAIGQFLGQKKGTYVPRTYYLNELNPNANFLAAKIVAAQTYTPKNGGPGFRITLEDQEQDRFIFTLEGEPAKVLAAASPYFSGVPLGATVLGKRFELKGARIKDIRRWKAPPPKHGTRGAVVYWLDPNGVEVVLHLDKKRYRAFTKNLYYFARRRRGFKTDESTIFNEKFDNRTAVLYKCDDLTVPGGVPKARLVYIDVRGERMISILYGNAAARQLENLRPLQNPVLRNIWQKAGLQMFSELRAKSTPSLKKTSRPNKSVGHKKRKTKKSSTEKKSAPGRETTRVPEKE